MTNTTLNYSEAAADKVGRYIALHRKLRVDRAYCDAGRVRELDTAAAAALHAILSANPATGFNDMIAQCNASDAQERAA